MQPVNLNHVRIETKEKSSGGCPVSGTAYPPEDDREKSYYFARFAFVRAVAQLNHSTSTGLATYIDE